MVGFLKTLIFGSVLILTIKTHWIESDCSPHFMLFLGRQNSSAFMVERDWTRPLGPLSGSQMKTF